MELNICHLYPDILNLYGDRGNIITMKRRRHGTDIVNVALLPRVKRTLHELQLFYFPLRNT